MKSNPATSDKSSTGSIKSSNPLQRPPESQVNSSREQPIIYRGHNNYDVTAASNEATLQEPYGESLTVQSQAEDADINVLMKRYGITGKMPEDIHDRIPTYGDFSGINDFRTALTAVQKANEAFMEVPAELRARFDNDPQKFLEYTSNPDNLVEMRKFGLAKPEPLIPPVSRDTQAILEALKPAPNKVDGNNPST